MGVGVSELAAAASRAAAKAAGFGLRLATCASGSRITHGELVADVDDPCLREREGRLDDDGVPSAAAAAAEEDTEEEDEDEGVFGVLGVVAVAAVASELADGVLGDLKMITGTRREEGDGDRLRLRLVECGVEVAATGSATTGAGASSSFSPSSIIIPPP